jgi:hypothetical protein
MALYIRIYDNLTPFGFYLGTLSPFIPLPLNMGKGEWISKRGLASLRLSFCISILIRRGGIYYRRGADAPLKHPYVTNPEQGEANLINLRG